MGASTEWEDEMLRLKYLITGSVLTLATALGLNLAWSSYASADTLYTFTFNEDVNQNEVVSGYFSIPVSDFSAAVASSEFSALTTNDITAISMTEGSQSFGPSELVSDVTLHFNMDDSDVPQVYYATNYNSLGSYPYYIVASPDGCETTTSCNYAVGPGNTTLVEYITPGSFSQVSGNWVTTTTPLPSTWTMMIAGFVGLGFFAYRGTKKTVAALVAA
jgi:hypothetical protein